MATHMNRHRMRNGYSLIELLVVLVIVGILALVGLSQLSPKSPKATRAALSEISAFLREARGLARSSGRMITLSSSTKTTPSGPIPRFTATDERGNLLLDVTLTPSSVRYANLATAKGDLAASTNIWDMDAASAYVDFKASGTGWTNNFYQATTYAFSSDGSVVKNTGGSFSTLPGGFWIGVVGKGKNNQGVPLGSIIVSQSGQIVSFYKPDSALDAPDEFKWQRME